MGWTVVYCVDFRPHHTYISHVASLSIPLHCSPSHTGGGLSCCHHGDVLLDADQPVDPRVDTYALKFRFWFQNYTAPTAAPSAAVSRAGGAVEGAGSHQNLHRFYFQTEAFAGEYDVVQCEAGTPSSQCIQEISAHFKVCVCVFDIYMYGDVSVDLIYSSQRFATPSTARWTRRARTATRQASSSSTCRATATPRAACPWSCTMRTRAI